MSSDRPFRLTEPCPPWCREDHTDQDHPADRYHQSRQIFVPVVIPRPPSDLAAGSGPFRVPEAAEMAVLAVQPVDHPTHAWIIVVGERQFMEVTVESARQLHAALGELLDEVR